MTRVHGDAHRAIGPSQYPVIASLHTEFTTHADKLISRPAPSSHITQVRSCQSDFGLCVFFFLSYCGSVEQVVPRLWFGKFCRLLGLGGEKRPVFSLRELKHKLRSRSWPSPWIYGARAFKTNPLVHLSRSAGVEPINLSLLSRFEGCGVCALVKAKQKSKVH